MVKKFLLVCLLVVMGATAGILTAPAQAGGVACQSYACQQAQQEIQYLYDAIWREKNRQYPNWNWIQQVQNRINWLNTIR